MSARSVTIRVRADEDEDDCLTAAASEYAAEHGLEGWNLDPRWEDDQRDGILLTVPRTVEAWWTWHDAEADRASGSVEEAEARASAWAAGESDDGPSGAS